jgi:lysozyme family protein
MLVDYKAFVDRMISKYEGGYGWDAKDSGGPTKYGITCYDLAEHRGQTMDSMSRWAPIVKAMPLSEAEDIYAHKYATAVRFNDLRAGVDCCMFDYGVNSGIGRPIRVARALLGAGAGDRLTDALVDQINAKDPAWFIDSMCKERMHFLQGLRIWGEFGHGWTARVNDLERYCDNLAKGTVPPMAPALPHPTPKGVHPVTPVGPKVGGVVAGGAAGGATVHAAGLPPWVVLGLLGLGVAGGVALVLWNQHKAVAANAKVVLPPNLKPHP